MTTLRDVVGAILLLALLPACNETQTAAQPKPKPELAGWQEYRFGMSLDEALAVAPATRWNAFALQECLEKLATDGCYLSADKTDNFFSAMEGIAFAPALSFNKLGQLTDIALSYRQEGDITAAQCEELFTRTLDRLVREDGPFSFPVERGPARTKVEKRTKAGNAYSISAPDGKIVFVTAVHRNRLEGVKLPTSLPIVKWNDRPYVSLFGVLIDVDGPICNVNISYNAAPSIERREM